MRWLILALVAIWSALTVVGYALVLPDTTRDEPVVNAYLALAADPPNDHVRAVLKAFSAEYTKPIASLADLDAPERARAMQAFRHAYTSITSTPLESIPTLVWSTDDNPARSVQCDLFRRWHLANYAEPINILPDPSNRDATKTIVQCIAGAGPDIIESYGPSELQQFVAAGVAMDVTEEAHANAFDTARVFPTAIASMAAENQSGELRQYAFPCNLGYTVLFFHRDMFQAAGIPEPNAPWSIDQAIEVASQLADTGRSAGQRRVGIMNLGAWDLALGAGGRFFNESATCCIYNSPATVAGFKAYQDMMYVHRVMPTPAEAASMASSGGAAMNATAESASASSLFAAKVTAMYVGGRWEYASLASRNRDRVIRPALQRGLQSAQGDRAAEMQAALAALGTEIHDLLTPMPQAVRSTIESVLTAGDRAKLINIGVAHVPTITGEPFYTANARVAIANRASPNAKYALRFLRFLASESYNEQINQTFDSICAVPEFCLDENGISGPPNPINGLEQFDSPIFVDAVQHAMPDELSPFIGRARLGLLAEQVIELLTSNDISPAEAARLCEDRINKQMHANITRDDLLRAEWERITDKTFDPARPLREQVEDGISDRGASG